jgi:soluble cytochrome b562
MQLSSNLPKHSDPTTELDKLQERNKILRDENQKLKELLKRNESIFECRLAEQKLEQQHLITLCNLMGPIIQTLNLQNTSALKIKGPPKSFQELIAQLDEVSRYIRSGALVTVKEVQACRSEVVQVKNEKN